MGGALSMRLEGWGQSQTLSWLAKAAISQLMMNKCCFDGAAFGVQLVRPEVHINPVVGPGKGMGKGLPAMPVDRSRNGRCGAMARVDQCSCLQVLV